MDLTPLFNEQFHKDFQSLSDWHMKNASSDMKVPIDFDQFIWTDAVDTLGEAELPQVPAAAKD